MGTVDTTVIALCETDQYGKAEIADPKDPVYPSNLSAALYELGDYTGSVEAICRAWSILKDRPDAKADLVVRLSTRLARALCHGVRARTIAMPDIGTYADVISQLRDLATGKLARPTIDDVSQSWKEWDTTRVECNEDIQRADACSNGLSRLPLFCKPLYVSYD